MDTKDVVQRFYDGLARKDSSWQDNLSESVAFSDASRKLSAQGREAFVQSFSGFLRAVDKVQLKQLIVEGPKAAAVVSYEYVNPAGGRVHQDDAEVGGHAPSVRRPPSMWSWRIATPSSFADSVRRSMSRNSR
jgi:ketosteroid isomerase-like protein